MVAYNSSTLLPNTTVDVNCSAPSVSVCDCDTDDDETSLWYVGVILSVVFSILSNFGVNVQKYSFNFEGTKPKAEQRSYLWQPLWAGGLVMVASGAVGDMVALGFAAQSLVTPVGGATMVANVFFAYFWLGETLSIRDIVATLMIIGGILIITIFGNKEDACYTVQELMHMYHSDDVMVYASGFIVAMAIVFMITARAERKRLKYGPSSPRYLKLWQKIHRFGYPCLSGMVGAQDVLFAKSVAELIKSSVKGTNQFIYYETWALLFLMITFCLLQLHFLAKGLEKFDAVYIIPVFQCFFISGSILCGAVYFKEFEKFTLAQILSFSIGILVTLVGVVVLSTRKAGTQTVPPKDDGCQNDGDEFISADFSVGGSKARLIRVKEACSSVCTCCCKVFLPSHSATVVDDGVGVSSEIELEFSTGHGKRQQMSETQEGVSAESTIGGFAQQKQEALHRDGMPQETMAKSAYRCLPTHKASAVAGVEKSTASADSTLSLDGSTDEQEIEI